MIRRLSFLATGMGVLLTLFGCASPTAVDYERSALASFADYRCFAIDSRTERADYQDVVLSPIVDRRIERALRSELLAKGFTDECATPDFRVTFNTVTRSRTEINDFGYRHGGLFGRHPYAPFSGFGGYSQIDVNNYEEGTFIVDVIDQATNELVWRGAYVQRLGWSAPADAEIRAIVSEILQDFPPGGIQ